MVTRNILYNMIRPSPAVNFCCIYIGPMLVAMLVHHVGPMLVPMLHKGYVMVGSGNILMDKIEMLGQH